MDSKKIMQEDAQFLNSGLYDKLKFLAQILLPALGTLYFALAGIWDFPDAEKVIGSITAVDTFLGVMLGISTVAYNKSQARYVGVINVIDAPDGSKKTYSLDLKGQPEDLETMDEAIFKVNQPRGDS